MPKTIDEVQNENLESKIIALEKQNQRLKSENASFREQLGNQEILAEKVKDAVLEIQPIKPPSIKIPKVKGEHLQPIVASLQTGDLHCGEVVTPENTDRWGKYNYDIACDKAHFLIDKYIRWIQDCRKAGWNIKECFLWNLGDSIAGDIHDELTITNEFPVPVQMVKAGELYTIMARRLAGHFEKVSIRTFSGNHDRLFRKKQYKQRAENSAAFVVHNIMAKALDRQKNVQLELSTSDPDLIQINGWNFLSGHGDNIRGWSGHPWYGWDRNDKKESFRRMNTDEGFHYRVFAHWHVPIWHIYRIGTGSFFGTNELDHSQGRTSPPVQVAYLIHRKRGVFNMMQFQLDK